MRTSLVVTLVVLAVFAASQQVDAACECGWDAKFPIYMYEDTTGEFRATVWGSYRKWDCRLNYVSSPSSSAKLGKCKYDYYPAKDWFGKDYVEWRVDGECQDRIWPATSCWGFKWDQSFNQAYDMEIREWNDSPTAKTKTVYTSEDTSTVITLEGDDVDAGHAGNLRFWVGSWTVDGGTLKNYDGTNLALNGYTKEARIRFYPNANQNKATGYTPKFEYWTQDPGDQWSSKAIITVDVTAVNDVPVANSQSVSTNEDVSKVITLTGTDIEDSNGSLRRYLRSLPTRGTLKQYSGGSVTSTSQVTDSSGRVRYYPAANDFGGPYNFKFRVRDSNNAYSSDKTVGITVNSVNDRPTGVTNFAGTTAEDTAKLFTLTGSDIDGPNTPVQYLIKTFPTGSTGTLCQESGCVWTTVNGKKLVTSPTGKVRFTPAAHFHGTASFQYVAWDGAAESSATGTATITVTPVNDPPCAGRFSGTSCVNDMAVQTGNEDVEFTLDDLAAVDVDGDTMTYQIYSAPTRGTLKSSTGTTLTSFSACTKSGLKFKALANENTDTHGSGGVYATFQYRVYDGKVYSQPRTVTIDVNPVNDAPSSTNSFTFQTDMTSSTSQLTLSGTDIDSSTLNYRIVNNGGVTVKNAGGGTVANGALVGGNKITLTGFTAGVNTASPPYKTAEITYQTFDGALNGPTGKITLVVYPPPTVGTFNPSTETAAGNKPIVISGNDFTTGGQSLSVKIGGKNCPVTASALTSVTCTLPAGVGNNKNVEVTRGSSTVASASKFSYTPPSVTNSNPTAARAATKIKGGDTVDIVGSDFGPPPGTGNVVSINNKNCAPLTYVSNTVARCGVPNPNAGNRLDLSVKVNVGGQQTTSAYKFSYLDSTAPLAGTLVGGLNVLDGESASADAAFSTSDSTLKVILKGASEAESEISTVEYAVGTTQGATNTIAWTSAFAVSGGEKNAITANKQITITKTAGFFTNGQSYYVSVRATNLHGYTSAWNGNGVKIDTTPPTGGSIRGPQGTSALEYQRDATQLSFTWTGFSDAESGIKEYSYTLEDTDSNVVTGPTTTTQTSVTLTGLTLTNNKQYRLKVTATNNVNLAQAAAVLSANVWIDTVAPSYAGAINDGSGGDVQYQNNPGAIQANWAAFTENESGIDKYEWRVVEQGQTASVAGLDWSTTSGAATSASGAPSSPFGNGKTYEVQVRATDKAGGVSTVYTSNGVTIDTTPPGSSTLRDGETAPDIAWYTSTADMWGNWNAFNDAESGIASLELGIGSTPGATDIQAYTNAGTGTKFQLQTLTLATNTLYFLSIKATNGASLSTSETSNGFRIDTTAPAITATAGKVFAGKTPGVHSSTQKDDTSIACSWTDFQEPESGVAYYEWAVGTTTGGEETVTFTNVGKSTSGQATVAQMADKSNHYCRVRAMNNAGLLSNVAVSAAIQITSSPPTGGAVYDGIAASLADDIDYQSSTTSFSFSWEGFNFDNFVDFRWELHEDDFTGAAIRNGNYPGAAPTKTDETIASGLNLTPGKKYLVRMQVESTGGTGPWVESDGVTIDNTPPTAGTVKDNGLWSSSLADITAKWDGTDGSADFTETVGTLTYAYCIAGATSQPAANSACTGGPVSAWTDLGTSRTISRNDLTLEDFGVGSKVFYVKIRATNNVGLMAYAISDGVQIDSVAPAGTAPSDGADPNQDLEFSSSADTIAATWDKFTATSDIAKHEVAIGTSSGSADILAFTTTGNPADAKQSFTKTGGFLAALSDRMYYVTVRATSNSGLTTDLHSNGFLRDTTAPDAGSVSRGGDAAKDITVQTARGTISLTWTSFSDAGSGLSKYEAAVSTAATPSGDKVAWTDVTVTSGDGTHTVNLAANNLLEDGTSYYVAIRAVDKVGLKSTAVSTGAILVDGSAPTATTVAVTGTVAAKDNSNNDVLFTSDATSIATTFSFAEPHSTIDEYQWALSDKAGLTGTSAASEFSCTDGCFNWESLGATASGSKTGLTLTQGKSYYLYTRAINQAGLSGYQPVAKPIVVDTTPPSGNPVTVVGVVNAAGGKAYTSETAKIDATFTAFTDSESPVTHQWAIGSTANPEAVQAFAAVADPTATQTTNTATADGNSYIVSVRGTNGANLQTTTDSLEVVVDGSKPDIAAATVQFVANDGSGTALSYITDLNTLEGTWSGFADPHSGILDFEWAFSTSSDPAGATFTQTATGGTGSLSLTTPLVDKTTYYLHARAKNYANLMSDVKTSTGILVDVNNPTPGTVEDRNAAQDPKDIDYQIEKNQLHAAFTAFSECATGCSGIAKYEWKAYYKNGNVEINVFPYEDTGSATPTALSKTGLALTEGETYYIRVRGTDAAGNFAEAESDGTLILDPNSAGLAADPPKPLDGLFADKTGVLPVDKDIWTKTDAFTAHWGTFSDKTDPNAIGTVTYEFGIHNADTITDTGTPAVVNYVSKQNADLREPETDWYEADLTGLTLVEGTRYYAVVRGCDLFGTCKARVSDGFTVIATPPNAGVVNDGEQPPDVDVTIAADMLSANWDAWSFSAPLDTIPGLSFIYQVSIGTTAGATDVLDWTTEGSRTFSMPALNAAASSQETTDAGVIQLKAQQYFVNVRGFPTLNNEIESSVKSSDASSDGILIDGSPPTGEVRLSPMPAKFKNIQWYPFPSKTVTLDFSNFADPESEPLEFRYKIDWVETADTNSSTPVQPTANANTTITDWSLWDSAKNPSISWSDDLPKDSAIDVMKHMESYKVTVEIRNQAGGQSTAFLVWKNDETPPTTGVVDDSDRFFTVVEDIDFTVMRNYIAFKWPKGSLDDSEESGIATATYQVGTTPYGSDLIPQTPIPDSSLNLNQELVTPNVTLNDNTTYYASVSATNGAGLTTKLSSDGIKIDNTPPTGGAVGLNSGKVHPRYSNDPTRVYGTYSGFYDTESDLANLEYCLFRADEEPETWSSLSRTATQVNITGRFNENTRYLLAVKATNRAGLVTIVRSTDFVLFDTQVPTPIRDPREGLPIEARENYVPDTEAPDEGLVNADFQSHTDSISANWELFADAGGSGMWKYEWGVGTERGGAQDVLPFTSVGIRTMPIGPRKVQMAVVERKGLDLKHGATYFVTVRGYDNANNVAWGYADGVTIDTTPPLIANALVNDGPTTIDRDLQSDNRTLAATWSDFDDLESGIAHYHFCIGNQPDVCNKTLMLDPRMEGLERDKLEKDGWYSTVEAPRVSLNLTVVIRQNNTDKTVAFGPLVKGNNVTYFSIVRATNGAGLSSIKSSNGVKIGDNNERVVNREPVDGVVGDKKSSTDSNDVIIAAVASGGVIGAGIAGFLGLRSLRKRGKKMKSLSERNARRAALAAPAGPAAAESDAFLGDLEPLEATQGVSFESMDTFDPLDEVESSDFI